MLNIVIIIRTTPHNQSTRYHTESKKVQYGSPEAVPLPGVVFSSYGKQISKTHHSPFPQWVHSKTSRLAAVITRSLWQAHPSVASPCSVCADRCNKDNMWVL